MDIYHVNKFYISFIGRGALVLPKGGGALVRGGFCPPQADRGGFCQGGLRPTLAIT